MKDNDKTQNQITSEDEINIDFSKFPTFQERLIEFLKKHLQNQEEPKEMAEYLFKKLNEIGSEITKETVQNWLNGKHQPKIEPSYRRQMYEICFALKLSYEETVSFFQHVYYSRAFNYHTITECVFSYAFLNQLSYHDALAIIEEINKPSSDCQAEPEPMENNQTSSDCQAKPENYTFFLKKRIYDLQSIEDLKNFLTDNKHNFDSWNQTAFNEIQSLVKKLCPSDDGKQKIKKSLQTKKVSRNQKLTLDDNTHYGLVIREIIFNAEHSGEPSGTYFQETIYNKNITSNDFLLNSLLTTSSGMKKTQTKIPSVVRNNFPSKKVLSDLLSEEKITHSQSYDAIRKTIILLDFCRFWIEVKLAPHEDNPLKEEQQHKEYCNNYLAETNARLDLCCYESLCEDNPYDYIFLSSIKKKEPFDFFREFISDLLDET